MKDQCHMKAVSSVTSIYSPLSSASKGAHFCYTNTDTSQVCIDLLKLLQLQTCLHTVDFLEPEVKAANVASLEGSESSGEDALWGFMTGSFPKF